MVVRCLLFLCGQIGVMALARFFFQWLVKFTTLDNGTGVLFAATAVGVLFLGFRIFDGVTDPIAGAITETWVQTGRQRRTLLLLFWFLPALGLVMVFLPNHDMAVGARWLLITAGMFIFFVGYTVYAIPYWSLIEEYSAGNPDHRRLFSNLLGVGTLLATAIGFGVSPILVSKMGYLPAAICFAIPAAVMMILPFFAAPKNLEPAVRTEASISVRGAVQSFAKALRHRPFIAFVLLFSGSQMSLTVMTAASPFVAESLLGGTEADVAKLMGPLMLHAIPYFLITPWLSRKFGWRGPMVIASIALAGVYIACGALGRGIIGTPMTTAMVVFAMGGPMLAILLGLEGEAIADCAKQEGDGQLGVYFGVFNLIVKIMNGFAIVITAVMADAVPKLGATAVRGMPIAAGICLVLGVVAYFVVSPGKASGRPEPAV